MRRCLLALTVLAACSTAQRATSQFTVIRGASNVGARVIGVELPIGEQLTERHDIALVEIDNPTGARVGIAADGFSQVGNGSVDSTVHTAGGAGAIGTTGGGFGGSGSFGSGGSGSGGSGSLGSAGGAAGSVGAGALGLALLIPVAIGALVSFATTQVPGMPHAVGPGKSVVGVRIAHPTDDRPQHVVLAIRSAMTAESITVPLFDPTRSHGGWNRPHRLERFVLRAGGGPFWGDGHYSGTGGLEFLATTPIGPTTLGIGTSLGVDVSAVAELAVPRSLFDDWLRLVPSIDVRAGGTIVGHTTFLSPTLGLDALVAIDRSKLFGYSAVRNHIGLYGRVGPVWLGDGERLYRWEVGLSFR